MTPSIERFDPHYCPVLPNRLTPALLTDLNSAMALLTIPDPIYIVVRDTASASAWYIEKLGCHRVPLTPDDEEGSVVLKYDNEGSAIVLGPPPPESAPASPTPILYAAHIQKAREALSSRGVYVGAIEQDRQGTHYFEMRDLDDNVIEVSEEP